MVRRVVAPTVGSSRRIFDAKLLTKLLRDGHDLLGIELLEMRENERKLKALIVADEREQSCARARARNAPYPQLFLQQSECLEEIT